jgi:hypothetical protein
MITSNRPFKKLNRVTGKWESVPATPTVKEVANVYVSRVDFKRSGFEGSIEKMIEKQTKYKRKKRKPHQNGK